MASVLQCSSVPCDLGAVALWVLVSATSQNRIDLSRLADYAKPMKVTAQYAEEHFDDVLQAAEKGEEIVIARPGKPNLVLVPQPDPAPEKAARIPRRELLGVWEGLVHVPDEEEWRTIKKAFAAEMPDFSPVTDETV